MSFKEFTWPKKTMQFLGKKKKNTPKAAPERNKWNKYYATYDPYSSHPSTEVFLPYWPTNNLIQHFLPKVTWFGKERALW